MLHINCKLHKTTDFYFLVLWTDDEKLSDVISHRDVMPPKGVNILDLKPGGECKPRYKGKSSKLLVLVSSH